MPLNTFDDIEAGLQAWVEDDDAEFTGSIPDIIDLAEKRVLRDIDLAIFRRTDTTLVMTATQALDTKPVIAPPDLLIATKGIYLTGGALTGSTFLENRSNEYVLDYNNGVADGTPRYFGEVSETQWIWGPPPDATYTVNVRFLSRPDRLTAANQTNWLSDNVYDFLFKAALAETEKFLIAEERVPLWEADYQMALPKVRRELYNQFGNQYDNLGAVPVPQAPRSANA